MIECKLCKFKTEDRRAMRTHLKSQHGKKNNLKQFMVREFEKKSILKRLKEYAER